MEIKTLTPSPPQRTSFLFYQISVLLITVSAYASFHASRKPPSIVKSVLGPELGENSIKNGTGWAPFDGEQGTHRLGELDLASLSAYSLGMYFSGHVGDRFNLKVFLVIGMVGSGVSTVVFGLGYWWSVHRLWYFLVVQIVRGFFQSIGWPCVVSVVGNWFGKAKRGLIMGIWNSHTSFGNIVGSIAAASMLEFGWGWSFVLPGVLIIVVGVFVYLFLIVNPEEVGFEAPGKHTAVAGVQLSHKMAGNLSTIFDIGGVIGGISASYISDRIEDQAVTSVSFLLLSIPALILYRTYGGISMFMNIGLMLVSGLFVNGPYSLITMAVSADLSTQTLIKGNSRALATVTAIIDGTGSIGAALGPLLIGYISTRGWNSVFMMLIISIFLAGLF